MTASTRTRPATKAAQPLTLDQMIATPGVYRVQVTPEMAAILLERNTGNRKPKERKIQIFARDMRAGHWKLTNQGVGIDWNGVLADGQNRLMACLEAGVPFETYLVTGMDPEARAVVDTGTARTLADVLRMHGKTNVTQLAGAASLRMRYELLVREGRPYTQVDAKIARAVAGHQDMLAYIEDTTSLEASLSALSAWREAFPRVPSSTLMVFESMAMESDKAAADEFRHSLVTGANLAPTDPRLVLRNFLVRVPGTRKGGPNAIYFLCVLIKGWNDWRNDLPREIIMMRENEKLPVMDEKPTWQERRRGRK